MKAIVLPQPGPDPDALQYREIPDPAPGPEDLLVRVHAAGLNRADLLQRRGGYPQPGPKPEHEVLGLEFAGEVMRCGDRVQGFAAGDRVMGILAGGGYAEQVVIHHRLAMRVPANLSWAEAGATPEVYVTAHDALLQCGFTTGERFLVHAAGSGVGVAAIQIAKVMGASFVAGTAGDDAKLARAKELGLDLGINYRTQDFAAEIAQATGGSGVDVILDVVGGDYVEKDLRSLAPKGRLIFVGLMGGGQAQVNLGMLLTKRLSMRGTVLRARPIEEKGAAIRAFEKSVLPHIASGRVKVVVDRTFPLAQAADAHRYLESNANFGKVVLTDE